MHADRRGSRRVDAGKRQTPSLRSGLVGTAGVLDMPLGVSVPFTIGLGLPDASVQVLQGIIFVFVLASDALYGRIGFLKGKT